MERASGPRRRAMMLFLLPLPLAAEALGAMVSGSLLRLATTAGCIALFWVAGGMITRGMAVEDDLANRRYIFHRPLPRKLIGALLAGFASAATSLLLANLPIMESIAYGIGATIGSLLLYGTDPSANAVAKAAGNALDREAANTLALADERIYAISLANRKIADAHISNQLSNIAGYARGVVDQLVRKPESISHAREFLNTYLEGAERIALGYAQTQGTAQATGVDAKFRELLENIEAVFAEQHQRLLSDEVSNLDVEIEVLKRQLKQEGVA